MPRILVTNDDGVHFEGIKALAEALAPLGEIIIVAPIQEASAIGHALTLRHPLRLETVRPGVFAVDGTPTDCVNVAIAHVLRGKPDLIVSGINKGWNLGDDVTYSGTVSGALEGALLGIPSIAVSTSSRGDECEFGPSAKAAATIAEAVLERGIDPRGRAYYWIEEGENHWEPHDKSDYQAVRDGYISITPLHPDMTAHHAMQYVEGLPLVSPAQVR
jgi:5'-nucleotidase